LKKPDARRVYYIHSIVESLAFSTVFTVSQVYRVLTVGLDPFQLVLVGTTLEISAFVFEIPTGVLADVYSRRLSTILGVLLTGLSFLIEGSFPVFPAVLLAQVVWGLGWTFISGANEAWIADEVGADQVGPVYLKSTTYGQVANLLAIPLGVVLGRLSLNMPFLIGGGLFLLLAVFLALFMPERGFHPVPNGDRETWKSVSRTFKEGMHLIRGRPAVLAFMGVALFIGLYSEGFDRLKEAHLLKNYRLPDYLNFDVVTWFGILRGGSALFTIAATEFVRRRLDMEDHHRIIRALQVSYGLVVLGMFIFAMTSRFEVALMAAWLVTTMRSTASPLNSAWINKQIHSSVRATVLSTTSQMDALGQFIGGPIVGAIGTLRSIRAALVTSGVLLLPVLPLYQRTDEDPAEVEGKLQVEA
jgi:DHA3 family tetracycline resistance protein-like MFS transporter